MRFPVRTSSNISVTWVQDVDRLTHNINRILDLARIESKTYGGKFVEKDLVGTIERFSEKNRHLFDGCEINIVNPLGGPFFYPSIPLCSKYC